MRINQLTFTRFLAAISIVIYHQGKKVFPFNNKLISFLFDQANIGVSYFFILSGFVMIIAYGAQSKVNAASYFKSRFARIYPVYLLAIIILLFYQMLANGSIDFSGMILSLFVIQAWMPGHALCFNSPGWSLVAEFFFYSIFPFLFNFIYTKRKLKTLVIPICSFWLISQIVFNWLVSSSFYQGFPSKSHDLLFYFPLMHLNEFLIGNLAGLFFRTKLSGKNKNYDWHLIFLISLFITALKYSIGLNFHNGTLAILFVPMILLISLNNGKFTKIFNTKCFIFLGEISYGIYILQKPVFFWCFELYKYLPIDSPAMKFYIGVVLLILTSGISYLVVEKPLRKWIQNLGTTTLVKQ